MACMALVSSVSQLHSLYAGRQGDHDGIGLGYALPFKLPLALTSPQWANFHGCPSFACVHCQWHPSDVGVNSSLPGDDPGPGRELEAAVTATQAVRVAGTGSASY